MKIFAIEMIHDFAKRHADSRRDLTAWHDHTKDAAWHDSEAIKVHHASASFLSDNRIVFNIKGNSYRLLVHVAYPYAFVTIMQVGTHAEYDRWNL